MKYTVAISEQDRATYKNGLCVPWLWACEQFGHPGGQNRRWNFDSHLRFFFRDESDAVLFALRWENGS